MKNKIIVLFSVLMLISSGASAQSIKLPTIVPASPEASSLAKYINYPVNHSSGLVEINIPLYEIKVGDLALPISLSYHASGIKINDKSGEVGLGWTLNAEPSISRSVKGFADENGYLSSYYSFPMDYKTTENYNARLSSGEKYLDEEPDEFYYKLLNQSGGFYIGKKPRSNDLPKFVLHPYAPISIDNSNIVNITNNGTPTINVFNIVDEKGVRYKFSNIETSSTNGWPTINTCWKASSITSAVTSQVISFQYQPGSIQTTLSSGDKIVVQDAISHNNTSDVGAAMGCDSFGSISLPRATNFINENTKYEYILNGQWVTGSCYPDHGGGSEYDVQPLRLKEINFTGGKVVFDFVNGLNIKVYNGTEVLKEFDFTLESTSYGSNTINRSVLKSLEVLDKNGVRIEKYQFSYYDFPSDPPALLTKSIDYWGYYNGAANDYHKSLVPRTTISTVGYPNTGPQNVEIGNANREPDFLNTRALSLMSITSPTGGRTSFYYQPNQYKEGSQIKNAGGLRIHEIFSPAGNRTFTYGTQEDGAGLLRSPATGDAFSCEQIDKYFVPGSLGGYTNNITVRNRTYYSSALTDLFYSGGCPVFYDFVREYLTDANGNSIGKTEYQYASEGSGGYGGNYRFPKTTLVVDLDWEWMFGQLVSKKIYKGNRATNSFALVSSNDYSYNTINSLNNSIYVGKTFQNINLINYPGPLSNPVGADEVRSGSVLYNLYTIPTGAMVMSKETSTTKNGDNELVTVTDYTYDNSVFPSPTAIKTTSSEGDLVTIRNKYPHDLLLTGPAELGRQGLITDHRIGILLEQSKEKGTSISKTRNDYGIFNGKAQPASVVTNTGASFADESRIVYDNYDVNGNLLGVSKNNTDKVCYVWGYNKLYPVAKIENATYAQVEALAGFGAGFTIATSLSAAQESALRGLPNAMVTTFKYSPMIGVTSITDPKGLITYYEYDSFNRLAVIKDQNSKIVKTFCYNYQGQVANCVKIIEYKSVIKTGNYKKNNCPSGYGGSSVVYTVAAGTYGSTISQAAADNLAQADVTANGQTYANANGSCSVLPAPAGLAFTSAAATSINFSWTAASGATGYKIYKNGAYVSTVTTASGSLSGLTVSTAYNIQVSAVYASGDSALCTTVSMTTLPAAPTGLTLNSGTLSSITFSWNPVVGATSYRIYKNGSFMGSVTTPSGSLSGLSSASTYYIDVSATNASGSGPSSSSVQMTTLSVGK